MKVSVLMVTKQGQVDIGGVIASPNRWWRFSDEGWKCFCKQEVDVNCHVCGKRFLCRHILVDIDIYVNRGSLVIITNFKIIVWSLYCQIYVLWVVFFVFEMNISHICRKKPENIRFCKRSLRSYNLRYLILWVWKVDSKKVKWRNHRYSSAYQKKRVCFFLGSLIR